MRKHFPKVLVAFLSGILFLLLSFSYASAVELDDDCLEYFACYAGCSDIVDPDANQACKESCDFDFPQCIERVDCDTLFLGCLYNCDGDGACMQECEEDYDDCALMCEAWGFCYDWCEEYDPIPGLCQQLVCDTYWPECDRDDCNDQLTACYNDCDGSAVCYVNCDEDFWCSDPCEGWQLCLDWCGDGASDPEACSENCNEEYPECWEEEEPTCEEALQDCYDSCIMPACFTDVCDAQFDCEEPCEAWNLCNDLCRDTYTQEPMLSNCFETCDEQSPECPPEEDQPEEDECTDEDMQALQLCINYCEADPSVTDVEACKESCYFDWPDCPHDEEYKDCYDLCFENYTDPDDLVQCILDCQEEHPGDHNEPFELEQERCFEETTFFDYIDVPYTNWAWPPINFLTRIQIKLGAGIGPNSATFESRIVWGYGRDDEDNTQYKPGVFADTFLPARDLNRFEASKIATLISCYTIPDTQADITKPQIYTDVNQFSDEFMNRVVYRAAEVALFEGYQDGTYRPMQPITRAEFLKVLLTVGEFDIHAVTYPTSGFTDVTDQTLWYYDYIAFASHQPDPIVQGFPDGTFRPNAPIKRDQAMNIVTNTFLNLGWISNGS